MLGINIYDDVEIRIHKIGSYYFVVTTGGGADSSVDYYQDFLEVSEHMKIESKEAILKMAGCFW